MYVAQTCYQIVTGMGPFWQCSPVQGALSYGYNLSNALSYYWGTAGMFWR